MIETVTIDEKGRMVLPKKVREKAGIRLGTKLVADVRGPGIVELRDSAVLVEKVQEVAAKKLTGWKEEEHKEDRLIMDYAK
ncbi:MAG: AbrB/MazE/SpoVT family DNA-binding domain-containing protein [Thaumarchaeota archaeon]|nr:AbrB/MazE/SpoVT family DNA-binding domain-containing protein [Nitrososphaerota archaeon]